MIEENLALPFATRVRFKRLTRAQFCIDGIAASA
jgi:hypothetical protein